MLRSPGSDSLGGAQEFQVNKHSVRSQAHWHGRIAVSWVPLGGLITAIQLRKVWIEKFPYGGGRPGSDRPARGLAWSGLWAHAMMNHLSDMTPLQAHDPGPGHPEWARNSSGPRAKLGAWSPWHSRLQLISTSVNTPGDTRSLFYALERKQFSLQLSTAGEAEKQTVFNVHVLMIVIPWDCYHPSADNKLDCRDHLGDGKSGFLRPLLGAFSALRSGGGH